MNETLSQSFSVEEAEKIVVSLGRKPQKKKKVEHQVAQVLANVLTHYPSMEAAKSSKLLKSLVHTCVKKNLDQQLCVLVYQSSLLSEKKTTALDNLRKDAFSYILRKDLRAQILEKG